MQSISHGLGFLVVVFALTLWLDMQARCQSTGAIEGSVEVKAASGGIRMGGGYGNPYQRRSSAKNKSGTQEERNVLVWITSSHNSPLTLRNDSIELNQRDKSFVPQLLPILQGETVRILNSDPVYHNVFSLSGIKRFDVGRRPKGDYKDVVFDKPGIVDVFCDIHSNMHAVVVVMPLTTYDWELLTDKRSFSFDDLPPGDYQVHVVAKGLTPVERVVTVKAGETESISTVQLSR